MMRVFAARHAMFKEMTRSARAMLRARRARYGDAAARGARAACHYCFAAARHAKMSYHIFAIIIYAAAPLRARYASIRRIFRDAPLAAMAVITLSPLRNTMSPRAARRCGSHASAAIC